MSSMHRTMQRKALRQQGKPWLNKWERATLNIPQQIVEAVADPKHTLLNIRGFLRGLLK